MKCIVTIVDSISATSMPVNEFVLYRSKNKYNLRQVLVVCDTYIPENVSLPSDIDVYLVGKKYRNIRSVIRTIINKYKDDEVIFHAHHQKSALRFMMASLGLGVRKRTLYTVHSTYADRNLKYKISSCICALLSNYVNCVSKSAFNDYSNFVKRIKKERIVYIQNGVDVDRIDKAVASLENSRNRKSIVCVGRMIPLKNQAFLVRLMPDLPGYKLVLIGKEDNNGFIRQLSKDLNVSNQVEFTGLISREELFMKLSESAIYASSSFIEGLPVSVLEAMCVGLLPIVSKINPHMEIYEYCKEVNVLDLKHEKWIDEIEMISKLSDDEYNEKSFQIRQDVIKYFSLSKMHSSYLDIYEKLV